MNELTVIGKRLYAAAYRIIVGPIEGGTKVSESPDPRDEEIAALKQQLADRDAAGQDTAKAPDAPAAEPGETVDGDTIIAEAKARLEAGEGLDGVHVRAIEHPEEFAGLQVPAPDTGIAPTS